MTSLKTITKLRRDRASIIFYLRGHGMTFRDIGKHLGQVRDPTKAMGVGHVHIIYQSEVRRRAKAAKAYRRRQKQEHAVEFMLHGTQTGRFPNPVTIIPDAHLGEPKYEIPKNAKIVHAAGDEIYPTTRDNVKAEIDLRGSLDKAFDHPPDVPENVRGSLKGAHDWDRDPVPGWKPYPAGHSHLRQSDPERFTNCPAAPTLKETMTEKPEWDSDELHPFLKDPARYCKD